MFIDENTTRAQLESAIACEDDLYSQFDEQKLLGGYYTTEELRSAVVSWIHAGNETE
jgi:hypothetical protein